MVETSYVGHEVHPPDLLVSWPRRSRPSPGERSRPAVLNMESHIELPSLRLGRTPRREGIPGTGYRDAPASMRRRRAPLAAPRGDPGAGARAEAKQVTAHGGPSALLVARSRCGGPARIHGNRPGHRVALPALVLAQIRAPESRSAARLLRTRLGRVSRTVKALASPGRSGCAEALPLSVAGALDQSRSPALADIIGARRACTAVMISSGSIPCR
jgi:hypothetical protein